MTVEQGGIYKHDFGPRQNHLQEGPRPVIVVQADALNQIQGYPNVIVVPLTTKEKKSATYVRVEPSDSNGLTAPSWAIGNQIFTIAKEDLRESLGVASKEEVYALKQALKIALGM